MKNIVCLIALCYCTFFCHAQNTLQKRIPFAKSSNATSQDVIEIGLNKFVLLGASRDSVQSKIISNLVLLCVDENGNTLWRKNYTDSATPNYFAYNGGRFLVLKDKSLYSISMSQKSNGLFGIFNKYNLNGDTIFSKKITDSNLSSDLYFRSIVTSSDNSFYITGSVVTPTPGYNGHPTYGMFVIKLDTLGNVLWYKKHYPSNLDMVHDGNDILEDSITKKIFVTGSRVLLNASNQGLLWILDNQGNLLSTKGTNGQFGVSAQSIVNRVDRNKLFSSFQFYPDRYGVGKDGYSAMLVETDSLGNLIKKIEFDTISAGNGFGKLICLQNNQIITSGGYETLGKFNNGVNNILRIAKFDENLNVMWKKYFDNYTKSPNYDGTHSLVYTQKHELVFTSDCESCIDTNPMTFMFYRTDTSYCDVNAIGCYSYNTVGLDNYENILQDVKLYPNPASNHFNIELNGQEFGNYNLEIVNYLGQVVFAQKLEANKTNKIKAENLENGLYLIQVTNNKGKTQKAKLIISN